ncbi:ribonuclease T [Pseudomonadales bacterium]|jgi:ribonuclease T|nr:ribonuclease T [Gammaproteobacteria bacterium]MDA0825218.1 ribonuclease T [Pseudomonadota bacterium]MDA7718088.1 ribonuclease T [Pseudomonadales bacterium]MBT7389367.1 ribonuclease T [Gammaproteobacteria bacterium]MCH9821488.1 ribonuclease T [Gammaproteobacteria bacterium]
MNDAKLPIAYRFRGFLPVVIDVETGGFNAQTDALLEIAAVLIGMDDKGRLHAAEQFFFNVEPFEGANLEPAALEFTGINPSSALRGAVPEKDAMAAIFSAVRAEVKRTGCQRAIVVAHNASFDQGFLNQAAARCNLKRNPFHPFSSFDTATLAGLVYGQTVLARACAAAGIAFNNKEAHSAIYDCERTAEVFCDIVNRWPAPYDVAASNESAAAFDAD